MRPRLVYILRKQTYTSLRLSGNETTLLMEGADNDENATFALLMNAYDKALSFPFLPLPLLPFPGILQISNLYRKDRIDVYLSIVDQRIKLIYLARL